MAILVMDAKQGVNTECFSHMSGESFEDFDQDLLEKFGREHIGRHQWYRLSKKQKLDETHAILRDNYQEGILAKQFQ
jgi:hypothetical protein